MNAGIPTIAKARNLKRRWNDAKNVLYSNPTDSPYRGGVRQRRSRRSRRRTARRGCAHISANAGGGGHARTRDASARIGAVVGVSAIHVVAIGGKGVVSPRAIRPGAGRISARARYVRGGRGCRLHRRRV